MTTLFRILELESGTIKIDGVDIAKVDLNRLRSSLAIIPQVRVLRGLGAAAERGS